MATQHNRLSSAAISKTLLAGFALTLFTATHVPLSVPLLPAAALNIDKLFHFTAYAVLAGLLATAWQLSSGILRTRHLLWAWCAVAIFGAFDELTQIAVNRDCNIWDWLADTTGAAAGLLVFVWVRRRLAMRTTDAQ